MKRNPSAKITITVNLSKEVHKKLARLAIDQDRSLSAVVRRAVTSYLREVSDTR